MGLGWFGRLHRLPDVLRLLALTALIVAFARPQTTDLEVLSGEGVDVIVALDMSVSMNAVDMSEEQLQATLSSGVPPNNRFESARNILERFVMSRSQDRIGLVVFGPEAWLKYPLTLDYPRLVQTLDGLILDRGIQDARTGRCVNGCKLP